MNLIATYISGVRVILIGAYSIDDLYHIGQIDALGIRLIIVYFLVVICMVLSYLISCCMTSVLSTIYCVCIMYDAQCC